MQKSQKKQCLQRRSKPKCLHIPVLVFFLLVSFQSFGQTVSYPSYNTSPKPADATGMSSTAVQLAAKMHLGINFGNTMVTPEEGVWNSKVTESYVKFVKQKGFNTVRLSVGWVWGHLSDPDKMEIDPVWLARVKEVVGWCVENDIYVIVNAHADLGWLEDNVNAAMKDSVNAKQKALWEQIATTMRDFDEHLLFAGTNEPKAHDALEMAILNGYHETFINAVRSTGGKNSYRVLVVQGPYTDPHRTADLMTTFPADNIPNKLILEVHDYTPATFTILTQGDVSWGNMVYYWGAGNHSTIEPERNATGEEETLIDNEFQRIKENFVDKGIPVILGEYGAWKRNAIDNANYLPKDLDKHNQSVDYWTGYVTKQAKANGIIPYYFETGFMFDRANNVVKDQPLLDAIIAGYNDACSPTTIAPWTLVNDGSSQQTATATVAPGGSLIFGPQPVTGGSWSWSGPNNFSATTREVFISNIQASQAGNYVATYTNSGGCQSTQVFTITVNGGSNIVTIANRATGLLIDGMGRTSAGSTCSQWASSGSWNQMWILETSGAYVYIKNRNTGLYIDGRGNSTDGSHIGQWSSSTSNNLQWQQETTGGYIKFKNRATGLYLDGMGRTGNGEDLGQWSSSSNYNQQWTVATVTSGASLTETEEVIVEISDGNARLFPNPFTTGIKVLIRDPKVVRSIRMFDLAGKQVEAIIHENVKTEQTMGALLNTGLYIIQINGVNSRQSFKVIKK